MKETEINPHLKSAVVALSGGMDSTGLLLHLLRFNRQVFALSFNYGQKHSIELEKLTKNIEFLKEGGHKIFHHIIDISFMGDLFDSALLKDNSQDIPEGHYEDENMKQTVVPNRNAIFSSFLYGYAISLVKKIEAFPIEIALGVHSGDHTIYPDCRPEFFKVLDKAFKLGNWDSDKVLMYLPYVELNKFGILKDIQNSCDDLRIDFNSILRNTNTCYNPNAKGESCGKCGSCNERLEAFSKLNIVDPIEYVNPCLNFPLKDI